MSKSLSAFISTSLQHLSASRRSHSLTETVHFALLSFLGLISSFHNLSPDFGFLLFFSFLVYIAFFPTITFLIISQTDKRRQAILLAFFAFFFLSLEDLLYKLVCRIARADGQYQILTALIFRIFQRERLHGGIER